MHRVSPYSRAVVASPAGPAEVAGAWIDRRCPACGSTMVAALLRVDDAVLRCRGCGLVAI